MLILLKWPLQPGRLTLRKERIRITCLELNNKTYIVLSLKNLASSILSSEINKFLLLQLPNFTVKTNYTLIYTEDAMIQLLKVYNTA